jgi:hypothetical protein
MTKITLQGQSFDPEEAKVFLETLTSKGISCSDFQQGRIAGFAHESSFFLSFVVTTISGTASKLLAEVLFDYCKRKFSVKVDGKDIQGVPRAKLTKRISKKRRKKRKHN